MEGEGNSLSIGAEDQDSQRKPMLMAGSLQAPPEEAEALVVKEEDSIQDQDTTNPENLQHQEAQEENFQQRVRYFHCKDASGSQQRLPRFQELSRRWLDPVVRKKVQSVPEQFQDGSTEELEPLIQIHKTDV